MFLEMLSFGIVFPVIQSVIISDIKENTLYKYFHKYFEIESRDNFIVTLTTFTIVIFLVKMFVLSFISFKQSKFIFFTQAELSRKLFHAYLNKPYQFFIDNNTSTITKNTITVVSQVTQSLISSMVLISELFAMLGIFVFLIYIEPKGTILVCITLGLFSFMFQFFTKKKIKFYGNSYHINEGLRIQHIQQGLGAIKEVKVSNKIDFFVEKFNHFNLLSAKAGQFQHAIQSLPRFFLETITVITIFLLIFILTFYNYSINEIIPIITIYGLASFRLLPSFSRVLNALQSINYTKSSFEILNSVLNDNIKSLDISDTILTLKKNILISNLTFKYENAKRPVFSNISFEIPLGKSVVFTGKTGSGKSTMIDLLLGLLEQEEGQILINGEPLKNNLSDWRNSIGFIPQNIYLLDDTIKSNIAFGVPDDKVNILDLNRAMELAQINEFVSNLPNGINTMVGERGVKFSGGQRQRIVIARALYSNPTILFMDEATSALDDETEKELISAINSLKGKITMVIAAHRKSIIENCDIVIDFTKFKD